MWRIRWSYGTSQYAGFSVYAYSIEKPGIYVGYASSDSPSGSSTTYIYEGSGNFYLKILVANVQYTIIVEAPT